MATAVYVRIPGWLYNYAAAWIAKHNIDESHGIMHGAAVAANAAAIVDLMGDPHIDRDTITMAAFCHDLVDSKYVDEAAAVASLREELVAHLPSDSVDIIITVITNMSWSKRVANIKAGRPAIPPGPAALAIAIVADADQLDAYDPERVIKYQEERHKLADYPSREAMELHSRRWQRTVLVRRVLKYIDHYMTTPQAIEMARPLHDKLTAYVNEHYADLAGQEFDYGIW